MMFLIVLALMFGVYFNFIQQEDRLRKQEISPLEILQIQYDRGEISREEYLSQLHRLQ
jgi:uncharacterized membrane protein